MLRVAELCIFSLLVSHVMLPEHSLPNRWHRVPKSQEQESKILVCASVRVCVYSSKCKHALDKENLQVAGDTRPAVPALASGVTKQLV